MNFGSEGFMAKVDCSCSAGCFLLIFSKEWGEKKSLAAGKRMALLSELCKIRI